jgi:hypothetical protein
MIYINILRLRYKNKVEISQIVMNQRIQSNYY